MTPNHSSVVKAVAARGGFNLDSREGAGEFCEAVVKELHRADSNWGHLKKSGAQNQYNGHAVDAALYRTTGQTVDFIVGAGDPGAKPGWTLNEEDNYSSDMWFAPKMDEPEQPKPLDPDKLRDPELFYSDVRGSLGRVEENFNHIQCITKEDIRAAVKDVLDKELSRYYVEIPYVGKAKIAKTPR